MRAYGAAIGATAIALIIVALPAGQDARQRVSLVVIGGTVITLNAAREVLAPGAVAIDGDTIAGQRGGTVARTPM